VFIRHENGQWLYQVADELDAALTPAKLDLTLALADVYAKAAYNEDEGSEA
jgi:hypothetical protein